MESILEGLATFLLEDLGQTIKRWSVRFQTLAHTEAQEVEQRINRSIFKSYFRIPSPDYIEAMIGDLLERQNYLKRKQVSSCYILLLTLLKLMQMALDIAIIALQDLISGDSKSPPAESVDAAATPEVISDSSTSDSDLL